MSGYVGAIEDLTLSKTCFRQVLHNAKHAPLVLMCLPPGEEIGDEVHDDVDQFFRIERGDARFVFNGKEEHLLHDGDAVVVPAGTCHLVVNASKAAGLTLYTTYSPPHDPDGTLGARAEAAGIEMSPARKETP